MSLLYMMIMFDLFPQNMTPLTVAAYLARMEMFFHIANIEREVYWQIGNHICSICVVQTFKKIGPCL